MKTKKRKLLSVSKYAELAGVSNLAIWKRIRQGTLNKVIHKGYIYIDVSEAKVLKRQKAGRKRIPEIIEN